MAAQGGGLHDPGIAPGRLRRLLSLRDLQNGRKGRPPRDPALR